jgi:hypothetical protein
MALALTQSLTKMSTWNIFWGDKGGRCVGLTIVMKSGSLNLLEPYGPAKACTGIALPLLLTQFIHIHNYPQHT